MCCCVIDITDTMLAQFVVICLSPDISNVGALSTATGLFGRKLCLCLFAIVNLDYYPNICVY